MRRFPLFVSLLLLLVWAAAACVPYANVATRTVETVGAAEILAAKLGVEAHRLEVVGLTEKAKARRVELGCGEAGPPPYPAGCKEAEWVEARDAARADLDAAKKRYEAFRLAMVTLDAALTETALSVKVYLDTNGDFDLGAVVAALLKSWGVVSALLREYGATPPVVGGAR